MHLKFWFKTVLYCFWPVRLGYMAKLEKYKGTQFNVENDEQLLKQLIDNKEASESEKGLEYKKFKDYGQYIDVQKQKFSSMIKNYGAFSKKLECSVRLRFHSRFKILSRWLDKNAQIICLGARQGSEVEVLRDIGFKKAYGIDVFPGPDNPFVRCGDFMNMDNEDSSIDFIYSNSIDHVYDLDTFFQEQSRILKADGLVMFEFAIQPSMGIYESVYWKDVSIPINIMCKYFGEILSKGKDDKQKWVIARKTI